MSEPDVPADHVQCWCQYGGSGVCGMRWSPKDPGEPFPRFPPEPVGEVAA